MSCVLTLLTHIIAMSCVIGHLTRRASAFFFCFFLNDTSILSFETINKLKLSFECGIPRPQDAGHFRFRLFFDFLKSDLGQQSNLKVSTDYLQLQFFYPTIQCNCSACNVPPDAGLQK
jgi:hypothetical protein